MLYGCALPRVISVRIVRSWLIILSIASLLPYGAKAATWDPGAADYSGRKGTTIYVSKLGDNSDGTSWQKAFHTIQAALLAVPDAQGGHRVIVRPDTYAEANLYPAHKGAKGAFNLLVGDADGSLGSGATGWVVIDCSCPGVAVRMDASGMFKIIKSDLPETGFKTVDFWSPWRCEPGYSSIVWDRWVFRNLYGTGGEGGLGGEVDSEAKFSAVWDHCVGIGRFAGGGVISHTTREDEPVLFRRCYLMNLDWWGDAGGVYVRAHNRALPDRPDVTFEDCTIIGPDNAVQVGWNGVDTFYTRLRFKNCRLIVLNFSQPRGTPSSGIICAGLTDGKMLHIDFEDCTLMGFKVFGTRAGEVSYTTKGSNKVYVEFEQTVPKGFERLGLWPVATFESLAPPKIDHSPK
jgi:hypothetical protein